MRYGRATPRTFMLREVTSVCAARTLPQNGEIFHRPRTILVTAGAWLIFNVKRGSRLDSIPTEPIGNFLKNALPVTLSSAGPPPAARNISDVEVGGDVASRCGQLKRPAGGFDQCQGCTIYFKLTHPSRLHPAQRIS
jgi:hypothetical protein